MERSAFPNPLARHPAAVAESKAFARFLWWASRLKWATEPIDEDPGVSFAELAILFVLETASLPPLWCDDSWVLPELMSSVEFVLADIARVVGALFKFVVQNGALAGTACIRVRTLALVGYKCNRGFSAGLSRRPAISDP